MNILVFIPIHCLWGARSTGFRLPNSGMQLDRSPLEPGTDDSGSPISNADSAAWDGQDSVAAASNNGRSDEFDLKTGESAGENRYALGCEKVPRVG